MDEYTILRETIRDMRETINSKDSQIKTLTQALSDAKLENTELRNKLNEDPPAAIVIDDARERRLAERDLGEGLVPVRVRTTRDPAE